MQKKLINFLHLFTNHMDAWGITLVIVSICLFVHDAVSVQSIRLMLAIAAIYWFGFAVNDFYDASYDRADPSKATRNIFVGMRQTSCLMFLALLILIGIYRLGFAPYGLRGFLIFVPSIAVMWAYSAPPIRLKSRPILDLLTHTFFVQTYPYFVCLLLIDAPILLLDVGLLLFFACSSLAAQLEQQARDYAVDSLNDRNFTTTFGQSLTLTMLKFVSALLLAVGLTIFYSGIVPALIMPFFVLGTPPVVHRYFRRDTKRPERLIKASVLIGLIYTLGLWGYSLIF